MAAARSTMGASTGPIGAIDRARCRAAGRAGVLCRAGRPVRRRGTITDRLAGQAASRQPLRRDPADLPAVRAAWREGHFHPVAGREGDPVAGVREGLFVLDGRSDVAPRGGRPERRTDRRVRDVALRTCRRGSGRDHRERRRERQERPPDGPAGNLAAGQPAVLRASIRHFLVVPPGLGSTEPRPIERA